MSLLSLISINSLLTIKTSHRKLCAMDRKFGNTSVLLITCWYCTKVLRRIFQSAHARCDDIALLEINIHAVHIPSPSNANTRWDIDVCRQSCSYNEMQAFTTTTRATIFRSDPPQDTHISSRLFQAMIHVLQRGFKIGAVPFSTRIVWASGVY